MPITVYSPDLRTIEGGVSQFMLADNSVGAPEILAGAVGTSELADAGVTLAKLVNLANGTVIGRNTAGTGVPEAVTMSQLAALLQSALEAQSHQFSVLQRFAASAGIILNPGAAPASPAQGQLWAEADGSIWTRIASAIPIIQHGTWTPSFTFATPGDLNIVYSLQDGYWIRIGGLLLAGFRIQTTTFTWTTASGLARITGLPFNLSSNDSDHYPIFLKSYGGVSLNPTSGHQCPYVIAAGGSGIFNFQQQRLALAGQSTASMQPGSGSGFVSGQNINLRGGGGVGRLV